MTLDETIERPAPTPRGTGRRLLLALVLLLLIAAGLIAAAWQIPAMQRHIRSLAGLPLQSPRPVMAPPAPAPVSTAAALQAANPTAQEQAAQFAASGLDTRIAIMEERLARLDLQAKAASGNAARAEGLLIAFAARRALDRGAQLGFLEDQLRLRFADAQPNAVKTLIDASSAPVTLDSLYAELEKLAPRLSGEPPADDRWGWLKHEVSQLFIIRHQSTGSTRPEDRLARAKLLLASGKVDEAINEIGRMPGASAASEWTAAARRFDAVQRALDLVETTALLDTNRLKDASGARVDQPSPFADPAT